MRSVVCFLLVMLLAGPVGAQGPIRNNFDNDKISDLVIWRPSTGTWYVITSSGRKPAGGNWYPHQGGWSKQWGLPGDTPLTGDFDYDGISDLVVIRPGTLNWYFSYSKGGTSVIQFGLPGDSFSAADSAPPEGGPDGKDEMQSYRPSERVMYSRDSHTGKIWKSSKISVPLGSTFVSAQPLSQFRRVKVSQEAHSLFVRYVTSSGEQYVYFNHLFWGYDYNFPNNASHRVAASHRALPLIGDYDGDKNSDSTLYEKGQWRIFLTKIGFPELSPFFGSAAELPITGDYDGDGKDDLAVWHPTSGVWRIFSSGKNVGKPPPHLSLHKDYEFRTQWGLAGDLLPK